MQESLFSQHWYRVKDLMPQLHGHIEVHRHDYRDQIWYILEDKTSGRHHRFNASAFRFISLLDGYRSVDQAWDVISEHSGDDAPTQHEIIQLLAQLFSSNLLYSSNAINAEELFQRQEREQHYKFLQRLYNPISQKFPFWDPDSFLQRNLPKINWVFKKSFFILWLLIVLIAIVLAVQHWPAISADVKINALTPYHLTLLFVLYPLIKYLHELGHAFAVKAEGGEVHELGVVFFLFIPVPYVNASAASHFKNKYQRMLVGAIGIMVELFLAALGLFVWLATEPALIHDLAFTVMLLGGVSSVLFNGNPLIRYDGYYVFADFLELPNLAQRSNNYLKGLCQHYLFGLKQLTTTADSRVEAFWFILYSISSFAYRVGILWLIILYVTQKFFVIGIILACWLIAAQFIIPLLKLGYFVYDCIAIKENKFRIASVSLGLMGLLFVLLFVVPFPSYTNTQGVVWLPEDAQIRSEIEGYAGPLLEASNSPIAAGTNVIELKDPFLVTNVIVLQAKKYELEARYRAEKQEDLVKAQIKREEIPVIESNLAHEQAKLLSMHVKSQRAGQLMVPDADDLQDRFLKQGDLIGYVIDPSKPIVRTVITQADMGKFRSGIVSVELRLANHLNEVISARIVREIPEATDQLYSAALATLGGGNLILDPDQPDKLVTLEKFFQVDVEFEPIDVDLFIGMRAYVRFEHAGETLAKQWQRSVRQLFLRQFNV